MSAFIELEVMLYFSLEKYPKLAKIMKYNYEYHNYCSEKKIMKDCYEELGRNRKSRQF